MSSDEMTATEMEPTPGSPRMAPPAFRQRRRSRAPLLALLALLAFAGGVGVTIWALPALSQWWNGAPATSVAGRLPMVATAPRATPMPLLPADAARQDLLALRMTDLEDRLARVSVEAQGASGNAARAEGLLVAFAARRALDSGSSLGYIEGQLRLRFGQAQPRAVATIINAAHEPVTLVDLQAGFEDIAPGLPASAPDTDWWTALKSELSDVVIVRKATTPSPLPEKAVVRIRRLLASGRIEPAMAEVERLPGKAAADRWLQNARRYREARRALDLIETAAILETGQIRGGSGATVTQASPVAR